MSFDYFGLIYLVYYQNPGGWLPIKVQLLDSNAFEFQNHHLMSLLSFVSISIRIVTLSEAELLH